MIAEIDLFWEEETLFHADTEISYSSHVFPSIIVHFELWNPEWVYELFGVFHNIIED